jgi:hypothetical protein
MTMVGISGVMGWRHRQRANGAIVAAVHNLSKFARPVVIISAGEAAEFSFTPGTFLGHGRFGRLHFQQTLEEHHGARNSALAYRRADPDHHSSRALFPLKRRLFF